MTKQTLDEKLKGVGEKLDNSLKNAGHTLKTLSSMYLFYGEKLGDYPSFSSGGELFDPALAGFVFGGIEGSFYLGLNHIVGGPLYIGITALAFTSTFRAAQAIYRERKNETLYKQ